MGFDAPAMCSSNGVMTWRPCDTTAHRLVQGFFHPPLYHRTECQWEPTLSELTDGDSGRSPARWRIVNGRSTAPVVDPHSGCFPRRFAGNPVSVHHSCPGNPVSVHHSCPKRRTDTGFPPPKSHWTAGEVGGRAHGAWDHEMFARDLGWSVFQCVAVPLVAQKSAMAVRADRLADGHKSFIPKRLDCVP